MRALVCECTSVLGGRISLPFWKLIKKVEMPLHGSSADVAPSDL